MTVADTSVILALLDETHPRHHEARGALANGWITVTRGTLAETSTVVRRLAKDAGIDGNAAARRAVDGVCALAGFREAPPTDLDAVTGVFRRERPLSFADAWALVASVEGNEPLVTYDKPLLRAYRKAQSRR